MRLEPHLNRAAAILSCITSGAATFDVSLTGTGSTASRQPGLLPQMLRKSTCVEPPRWIVDVMRLSVGQLQDRIRLETRQMVVAPRTRWLSLRFVVRWRLHTIFGIDVF